MYSFRTLIRKWKVHIRYAQHQKDQTGFYPCPGLTCNRSYKKRHCSRPTKCSLPSLLQSQLFAFSLDALIPNVLLLSFHFSAAFFAQLLMKNVADSSNNFVRIVTRKEFFSRIRHDRSYKGTRLGRHEKNVQEEEEMRSLRKGEKLRRKKKNSAAG